MSFISSYWDRRLNKVLVWEKTESGNRIVVSHDPVYDFYVPSPEGTFSAVTGETLKKITCENKAEFDTLCIKYRTKFESDINPQEKVMMSYFDKPIPKLTIGFIDIEVDYDPAIGFSRPSNPYAPINSLTLYRSDLGSYLTFAVPPEGWDGNIPQEMIDDNYFIVRSEQELLEQFLLFLEDVDILSGWNSDFFDLPYIGKRIELLFGQTALKKLGFERGPLPRWGEQERFKGSTEKELVLDLISRVHLDYMRLFKKFNLGGRQSYSLGAIADEELDIPKLHYAGTLYELYRNDFIHFMLYNRRDVEILVKLDKKFKYIGLANEMVHEATVNFNAIFGSVQLIDTAIINFCHHRIGKIVFDRQSRPGQKVEGAIVMSPKVGLHKMLASGDINSLYPNTYRSLNLSPEKIVGQLSGYEEDWHAIRKAILNPDDVETLSRKVTVIIDGKTEPELAVYTVADLIKTCKENKFAISGYGTILDQGTGEGLLPAVLSYWFKERKKLQALKKEYANKAEEVLKNNGGNKLDEKYLEFIELSEYYDMLQGVKKVLLNSTYGATLNEFCRFHDSRLGASTTGSGRQITTHMIETIAKLLLGDNAPKLVKTVEIDKNGEPVNIYTIDCPDGLGPIYSDTDSVSKESLVMINDSEMTVEAAFNSLSNVYGFTDTNGKQMVWIDGSVKTPSMYGTGDLLGIYRHKCSKRRFKITLESGKSVIVTEDHSVMVLRDGQLKEVKPLEINKMTDICITLCE